MPTVPAAPLPRRLMLALAALLCALLVSVAVGLAAPPARAADRGAGFGTWAPLSAHGWHGSMLVNGVHTYCILPGLPLPTGASTDHGVTGSVAGLSPQQLAGINAIVTKHGQSGDPVRSAAVGWAVKAISNRDTTLHAWGYRGDSLAEAVRWSMARIVPEHSDRIAQLAEAYYTEAASTPAISADATLTLTTDPADARNGTVRLDAPAPGTIALTNATFTANGAAELPDAQPGAEYPIVAAAPSDDGAPFRVHARAHGVAGIAPAIRYVTTPNQQDTAGPGGSLEFVAEAQDATPRPVVFSPGLTTQVAQPQIDGGPFVDDVHLTAVDGVWPRTEDGAFVSIRATAKVYRTEEVPTEAAEVPDDAEPVADLALTTDPVTGPGTYRVTSDADLPGPGVYTAVWTITAESQSEETARHLQPGFAWTEKFGVATQMVTVTAPPPPPQAEQPPREDAPTPPEETRTLAATGADSNTARVGAAGAAALILGAAFLAHMMQRRRRAASV